LKSLKERDHSEDLGIDERVIWKWISGVWDEWVWNGFWRMISTGVGLL
jgi:hypothetical protein